MPVVFEDLEPELAPEGRPARVPRWAPGAAAVVVVGVVAALVARGGGSDAPRGAPPSPAASTVVSFVPTAARGVAVTPRSVDVVTLDQYALPGVMTVAGRAGWQFDAAGSTAEVRRYRALDLATGTLRSTVTFGVADRAPLATIEAETTRYCGTVTAGGATGLSIVYAAFDGAFAADLTYTTAGGRYVMERLWRHDGVALFVQVSDVWAETVTSMFADTVRYGAITP